mmetsp:Transcript_37388/g.68129  ORF Transcript_37388/g.68129 Transcript_37388/m.68129 type:complete len:106 (-) Transcript_37388:311-628(-)
MKSISFTHQASHGRRRDQLHVFRSQSASEEDRLDCLQWLESCWHAEADKDKKTQNIGTGNVPLVPVPMLQVALTLCLRDSQSSHSLGDWVVPSSGYLRLIPSSGH